VDSSEKKRKRGWKKEEGRHKKKTIRKPGRDLGRALALQSLSQKEPIHAQPKGKKKGERRGGHRRGEK